MPIAIALALLAQSQFIRLEGTTDDDRVLTATFSPSGDALFVAHATGGVNRVPFAAGPVTRAVAPGAVYEAVEFTPDGARLVCADFVGAAVHVFDAVTMAPLTSVPLSISDGQRLIIGLGSRQAVVIGAHRALWLDLVAGSELGSVVLPPYQSGSVSGVATRAVLADDDRTLIALENSGAQPMLRAIDLATGAVVATVPATPGANPGLVGTSGDRRRVVEMWGRHAPTWTQVIEYDARTLQRLETTTFFNELPPLTDLTIDTKADTCAFARGNRAHVFPLDGGTHAPGTTDVTTVAVDAIRVATSADLSRMLAIGPTSVLIDVVTGQRTRLGEGVGASPALLVATRSGAPSGPRFGAIVRERVALIEAGVAPLHGVARELNTGVGIEQDGPFFPVVLPGSDRAIVLAHRSDVVLDVDLVQGLVRGVLSTGRGPIAAATRADGVVLVGCLDGTVLSIDPDGFSELGRFDAGGPVVELVAEPQGADAWLRVEQGGADALVRYDTAAPAPQALTTIPLFGGTGPRVASPRRTKTLCIDFARSRAVIPSRREPFGVGAHQVELVDLALGAVIDREPGYGLEVVLSPTGDRAYVAAGLYGNAVGAFDVSAAGLVHRWSALTIPDPGTLFFAPWTTSGLALDAAGTHVLVNLSVVPEPFSASAGFVALDANTGAVRDTLGDLHSTEIVEIDGAFLVPRGTDLRVVRVDASGLFGTLEDVLAPGGSVDDVFMDAERGRALYASDDYGAFTPSVAGVGVIDLLGPRTSVHCDGGAPNATGVQASLTLEGSSFAGGRMTVVGAGLEPGAMFGTLLVGAAVSAPAPFPGSIGPLCISAPAHLAAPPVMTDAAGHQRHTFDTAPLPTSAGSVTVLPGDTYVFQLWHRDRTATGAAAGNTSTAVALRFR
jgi:hypothetical protein